MPVPVSSSVKNASTRIILSQKCQYPYRPLSQKCLYAYRPQSKNACTRIVLSQKCLYPYRPQSKRPVPVSSSVGQASTRIVLSQKGQYSYRPQSKRPVLVSSSVGQASIRIVLSQKDGCSSNGILPVWARQNKGQYPYRPQSKRPVPALAAQYPHRHVAHRDLHNNISITRRQGHHLPKSEHNSPPPRIGSNRHRTA